MKPAFVYILTWKLKKSIIKMIPDYLLGLQTGHSCASGKCCSEFFCFLFFFSFTVQLTQRSVLVGDWERKDARFCHSYHRTAAEERRKAEEDAGEDVCVCVCVCVKPFRSLWKRRIKSQHSLCCAGRCSGHHSHERTGPSDQWSDGTVHSQVPTVHVSTKSLKNALNSKITYFSLSFQLHQ